MPSFSKMPKISRDTFSYRHLGFEELKRIASDTGIKIPSAASAKSLATLLRRHALDKCLYLRCTIAEMKTFIAARNIDYTQKRPLKRQIIDALVNADTHLTFPLLELPAELRRMVYIFALAQENVLRAPKQPSLTRASRHVRQEALPCFYRTNRFIVNICACDFSNQPPKKKPLRHITDREIKYWEKQAPANMANVRNLWVNILSPWGDETTNRVVYDAMPLLTVDFTITRYRNGIVEIEMHMHDRPENMSAVASMALDNFNTDAVTNSFTWHALRRRGRTLNILGLKRFATNMPLNLLDIEAK